MKYDASEPAWLWNAPNEGRSFSRTSWENFGEHPGDPSIWVLYTNSPDRWAEIISVSIALWVWWLVMLIACIYAHVHHYTGDFAPAVSPWAVCVFGVLFAIATLGDIPQTLVLTDGVSEAKHILGFETYSIRRYIPLQKIRGLSLIYAKNPRGCSTSLYVKWVGNGVTMRIGCYSDKALAAERIKYISARTGLPIIAPQVRVVPPPKFGQTKGGSAK